jgi:heme-degrading monooxygenase HmoA
MYAVVWDYEVKSEAIEAFIEAYGAGGAWARLFRRGEGYMGTELFRSAEAPGRFLTIDRWRSREVFTEFMARFRELYAALDAKCGGWTISEHRVGEIEP